MRKHTWRTVSIIGLLGMLSIVGISAFMGGCDKMFETAAGGLTPMKCHGTFVATAFVGIIGAVSSLCALLGTTKEGRLFASIISLATTAVVILLTTPVGIGLCGNTDMPCHQTALAVWIAAGVVVVVSLVQISKADPQAANLPKRSL